MSTSTTTVSSHWPKPNYVNAPSRAGGAIAYNTILIVVVVIVVSLRYYSRVGILKQRLGWDDFFIGLSLVCLSRIVLSTVVIVRDVLLLIVLLSRYVHSPFPVPILSPTQSMATVVMSGIFCRPGTLGLLPAGLSSSFPSSWQQHSLASVCYVSTPEW